MSAPTSKVWFITGASRGFGRQFLPLQLDVTDRAADEAAVRQAFERFGRLTRVQQAPARSDAPRSRAERRQLVR